MKVYTSKDIQQLAKVSHMQISRWAEIGIIIPLEDAKGRGAVRKFSQQNLIEAMICKTLNDFSLSTSTMYGVLSHLRDRIIFSKEDRQEEYSFWEFFRQNPKTERVYLMVSLLGRAWSPEQSVSPSGYSFRLVTKEDMNRHMETYRAAIVINLRELISEAENL